MRRLVVAMLTTAAAALPATAAGSIGQPSLTLTPATATAGSTGNLTTQIKFSPSSGDTAKNLTLQLPAGLLADAATDGGACLHSSALVAACKVGSGTVTATPTLLPAPITLNATFYLVAPPSPDDLAGLALQVSDPFTGAPAQLGSPAAVTVRPATDPAGVGLNIAFTAIPNSFDGLGISLDEIDSTFTGLRFPATCPSSPADVVVTADSYSSSAPQTGRAPLRVTGCGGLAYAPRFGIAVARDAGDYGDAVTTTISQSAAQSPSRSISLSFPRDVIFPNPGVLGAFCAGLGSGNCSPVGSATTVTPLYPAPLVGKVYLLGSLASPSLQLVFPPPFSLSLTGQVNLTQNSASFNGIPDIPLTSLQVALDGGRAAIFQTWCNYPSGTATALATSQNGDRTASLSSGFTVAGCGSLTSSGASSASPAKPKLRSVKLSGLRPGRPALSFTVATSSAIDAPASLTVQLPAGLSFVRHRVHRRLTLTGVSSRGGQIRSARLAHGRLTVALKRPTRNLALRVTSRALSESRSLRGRVRRHRVRSLKLLVTSIPQAGPTTRLTATIKNPG